MVHERIKVILVGRTWGCKEMFCHCGGIKSRRNEVRVMETIIFHPETDKNAIAEAAAILCRGGLLGIPTETVYGLGADGLNEDAVRRIFEAKDGHRTTR